MLMMSLSKMCTTFTIKMIFDDDDDDDDNNDDNNVESASIEHKESLSLIYGTS